VNTELLDGLGLYISSAPVEGKGYKKIIKLPDCLNNQHNRIKSPKQYAGCRIYPFISTLFSHILCPDYPDPGFLWCDQLYPGSIIQCGMQIWKYHGFTIT